MQEIVRLAIERLSLVCLPKYEQEKFISSGYVFRKGMIILRRGNNFSQEEIEKIAEAYCLEQGVAETFVKHVAAKIKEKSVLH